jgi:hypothetical protein
MTLALGYEKWKYEQASDYQDRNSQHHGRFDRRRKKSEDGIDP